MSIRFDTYTIIARFFPGVISAIPLFVLWFFVSEIEDINGLVSYVCNVKFLGGLTVSIVLLYFFAQIIRVTSKFIEGVHFLNSKGLPTTYFMTYENDTFSVQYKDKYREQVHLRFGIKLLTAEEEHGQMEEARKRLDETTKQVILKVGDGRLVKKHNIWYGFFRNLLGGSTYAAIICLVNILIGHFLIENLVLMVSSTVLLSCYGAILVFYRQILNQNAEAYAKQLIAEFMSIE